jgi:hypothetical protein
MQEYRNVQDVYASVRQIRDSFLSRGEVDAAKTLDETISSFWTTSSEALGETKLALLRVRPIAEKVLDNETLCLLDRVVDAITKLWKGN